MADKIQHIKSQNFAQTEENAQSNLNSNLFLKLKVETSQKFENVYFFPKGVSDNYQHRLLQIKKIFNDDEHDRKVTENLQIKDFIRLKPGNWLNENVKK